MSRRHELGGWKTEGQRFARRRLGLKHKLKYNETDYPRSIGK